MNMLRRTAAVITAVAGLTLPFATFSQTAAAASVSWTHVAGDIRPGLWYGDVGFPVRVLQGDLWQLGYNPGPVDGWFGDHTLRALNQFQSDHGLSTTRGLTAATFDALLRAGGWGGTSPAEPPVKVTTSGSDSTAPVGQKTLTLTATAYGPSYQDNYPYGPVDYFGAPLKVGDVAVDPSVIPLGTRLWVSGYNSPYLPAGGFEAVARDTGGAIQGARIDIFIDGSPAQVSDFGIQTVKVTILGR